LDGLCRNCGAVPGVKKPRSCFQDTSGDLIK
jgi:hypothetical protein